MKLHPERIRENARNASTESLLDRVTVYRAEIESEAIEILEAELRRRGIEGAQVAAHAARRERDTLSRHADGTVIRCGFCERPATECRWSWYRLWGWFVPLFPRFTYLCKEHSENLPMDAYGRALHFEGQHREQDQGPIT